MIETLLGWTENRGDERDAHLIHNFGNCSIDRNAIPDCHYRWRTFTSWSRFVVDDESISISAPHRQLVIAVSIRTEDINDADVIRGSLIYLANQLENSLRVRRIDEEYWTMCGDVYILNGHRMLSRSSRNAISWTRDLHQFTICPPSDSPIESFSCSATLIRVIALSTIVEQRATGKKNK